MYTQALSGYEEILGEKHMSSLSGINALGIFYSDRGKLNEAEEMFMRALRGYREALEAKHTSTLLALNNLGNIYRS
jgi:tetratricopeptide (TPR) repeat protein